MIYDKFSRFWKCVSEEADGFMGYQAMIVCVFFSEESCYVDAGSEGRGDRKTSSFEMNTTHQL